MFGLYETKTDGGFAGVSPELLPFSQKLPMRFRKIITLAILAFALVPATLKAQKVMVTKNGTKYHTQDCRYATGATASDVKDALDKKLVPCEVCKPPAKPNGEGSQCKGKTKSGARCNRMTLAKNGMCWQHG